MRIKPLSEIIEEAKERLEREMEFERELEAEAKRERSLGECYDIIKQWKKKYFKKTLKKPAAIYGRICSHLIDGSWYDYRFIQLFKDGNRVEEYHVRPEAFDTLTRGMDEQTIPGRTMTMHLFVLHKYDPHATT